jgi:gluconate 2-dehydrogenase gamma chain
MGGGSFVNAFQISRRRALKYFGLLTASAAGREFLAAWLPASTAGANEGRGLVTLLGMPHSQDESPQGEAYKPKFFKPEQLKTVELLAEMIIPTDEEPGAKEARVAEYVDFVVYSAKEFEPDMRREWTEGLAFLERESQKRFGSAFRLASEANRVSLLTEMSLPERDPNTEREGFTFFRLAKEMTVEGFYTSKVGLMDVLNYQGMEYNADFPGCTHAEHQR